VAFTETMTREQVAVAIQSQSSIFIDWMRYNNANPDGRDLVYSDFPLYYTYNKKRGWQKRKKGQSIGRLPVATPRQGEHFYLRTLLTVKRGARSYRDLYTVNGIYHEFPSAACRAMGLTFDDSEWVSLFNEVKDTSSASSLRRTFAAAIHHAIVHDPQALWDQFKISFTDDCVWRMSRLGESLNSPPSDWSDDRRRFDFGLWLLEENLKDLGMDWAAARMSGPTHMWVTQRRNFLLDDALNFDRELESRTHDIFGSFFGRPESCSNLASLLSQTTLIIWDEVTMQLKHHFTAVDKLLRDITGR
ncbi:hypothetical protein EPUL_005897, partial [Erysiphe pulchra]